MMRISSYFVFWIVVLLINPIFSLQDSKRLTRKHQTNTTSHSPPLMERFFVFCQHSSLSSSPLTSRHLRTRRDAQEHMDTHESRRTTRGDTERGGNEEVDRRVTDEP